MKNKWLKKQILNLMKNKNLSVPSLERKAGLKIHAVRNILTDKIKKPKIHTLKAISSVLECSVEHLVNPSFSKDENSTYDISSKRELLFLEDVQLMMNSCDAILGFLRENKITLSLDEYLEVLKRVYYYSLSAESKVLDFKFIAWSINQKQKKP